MFCFKSAPLSTWHITDIENILEYFKDRKTARNRNTLHHHSGGRARARFYFSSTGAMASQVRQYQVFVNMGRNWSLHQLLVRPSRQVQCDIIAATPRYRLKKTEQTSTQKLVYSTIIHSSKTRKPRCPSLGEDWQTGKSPWTESGLVAA